MMSEINFSLTLQAKVAIYCKSHIQAKYIEFIQDMKYLEFVVIKVWAPIEAWIAAVYRPPCYNVTDFLRNMQSLLDSLEILAHQPIIICGDFHKDLLSNGNKQILQLFQSRGYSQLITTATTEKNTLLDHMYISQPQLC